MTVQFAKKARARIVQLLRFSRVPVKPGTTEELFPEPWPALEQDAVEVVAQLERGHSTPPRVGADALHLVSATLRGDPIAEAHELLERGYRPRVDAPLWPVKLPVDWSLDPFSDRNWCSQLNMLRLLDPLIRAHAANGDPSLLSTALAWALDWHHFHVVQGHDHELAWRDMMTGVRSLRLAYLADQLRQRNFEATAAQRAALADAILVHWRKLITPGFFRYTNHTIWDLHGLTALVRVTLPDHDPRHVAWLGALGRRLDHLVDAQFDAQGIHRENSPQYHFVASGMFRTLAACGWYAAVAPRVIERLELARSQEHWMRLPDGRHIAIGDSDGKAPSTAARLPRPAAEPPGARTEWLNHSCYCFVRRTHPARRQHWSHLAIKAGFDRAGHKHNDELSFLWSESGCDIVVDAGKFAYDQNEMRAHMLSNRAHNLITFGEAENDHLPKYRTGHLIRSLDETPWGVRIRARIEHRPTAVEHERCWHYAPGRWLVLVDRFAAAKTVPFVHWTHLAPEFSISEDEEALLAHHVHGGTLRLEHRADVAVTRQIVRGQSHPQLQGWISRGYRTAEAAPALGLGGSARRGCIVMAMSLDPSGRLEPGVAGGLQWACGDTVVPLDAAAL